MASEYFVTIKLEPFYQHFLRQHFSQHDTLFAFPPKHDLLKRLQAFLTKTPDNYKPLSQNETTFSISLPFMEHKNVAVYNCITAEKNNLFASRVREYFHLVFHDYISRYRKEGFYRNEIISIFMDDFKIEPKHSDRIEKEFNRYLQKERFRRFAKIKKQKSLSGKTPICP